MRMSCNGCRVLRKGCSDDCVIRPCLQWINSSDSQANATMFLAKFYGRAGLINLISAGPEHLRPAIFRSLLYEACGRIINPIYGSVGLLWSGNWKECQSAVDSVLKGSANFAGHPTLAGSAQHFPALKTYDIRHLPKPSGNPAATTTTTPNDIHKVRDGPRFKRHGLLKTSESKPAVSRWLYDVTSCESMWMMSRAAPKSDSPETTGSVFSVETVEASLASRSGQDQILRFDRPKSSESEDRHLVKLDLTLGMGPHPDASCKPELLDHQ